MKIRLSLLFALLVLAPAALWAERPAADQSRNCGCTCCAGKSVCCCHDASTTTSDPKAGEENVRRHPLKGVIVDILADQSALLVKHEAIPGYMPAMTMLFKVDAATLKAAIKGRTIAGTLVQRDDGFWLEDVTVTSE